MTFVIYKFTIHLKLTCKGTHRNTKPLYSRECLLSKPERKPLFSADGSLTVKNLNKIMVNTCLGSGKKRIPDNGQQCGCFFYKLHISCNMKLCSPQLKGKKD